MLITDILVSIACAYGARNISRNTKSQTLLRKYWIWFFVFCSVSFFFSAIAHTIKFKFSDALSSISWMLSIAGVTSFVLGVASTSKRIKKWQKTLLWIYAIFNMTLIALGVNFIWIVIYCFAIMFLTIAINAYEKIISFKNNHSKGILLGTFIFILAAFAYILFRDEKSFDVRLLSHVMLAVGIVMFANSCKDTITKFT